MSRTIFHIDVNSAFLSWSAVEQLKNGADRDLREIPSIIGGDQASRHGVVLAKSLSAKKYGIRTGEPVVDAIRKCPNLSICPPDHKLYSASSRALMTFLRTYTTQIEQVSVDECYMDFTELAKKYSSPVKAAREIKDEVYKRFGFTVNVGISENKLLAKMASDFEKPNKVHTLFPDEIKEKMWPLPIGELFMAGRSSVEQLKKLEIYTIGDLAKMDPELLELHLKSHGRKLWEFANGIDDSPVEPVRQEAKGIGNSTTLPRDAETEEEALEVLEALSESVGRRLKKASQKAGMLSVEIKYYNFESTSHQKQLERATNESLAIYKAAAELFREMWTQQPIRLLGVRSSKLVEADAPEQLTLFEVQPEMEKRKKNSEKRAKLDQALKEIRGRYGEEAVIRGSNMEERKQKNIDKENFQEYT
ncbi:MAG: DNA polymerase IV [Lachnospiraceae bacterium]|nr:DNA polymerase IV [Lachnospiraceae bacterium]